MLITNYVRTLKHQVYPKKYLAPLFYGSVMITITIALQANKILGLEKISFVIVEKSRRGKSYLLKVNRKHEMLFPLFILRIDLIHVSGISSYYIILATLFDRFYRFEYICLYFIFDYDYDQWSDLKVFNLNLYFSFHIFVFYW